MNNSIRKRLNASGKMPCEICGELHYLEDHHIHGRNIFQFDAKWNRCNVCSNCHTKIHKGDIIIEGWFSTNDGLTLLWHTDSEDSFTGTDAKPHLI